MSRGRFYVIFLALVGFGILLTSCASSKERPTYRTDADTRAETASSGPVNFQIIYVVHGDANYTYHDSTGKWHAADSEAVVQALYVARNSPQTEVFIFHQKVRRTKLFGRTTDGVFYHYRGGIRIHEEAYSRLQDSNFRIESDLYHEYSLPSLSQPLTSFFVYSGHEFPASDGAVYSQSYPKRNFSLPEFARAIDRFQGPASDREKPFALIVLSTCYGGSPATIKTLSTFCHFLVASPAYLHLSYLDTRAFKDLSESGAVPLDTGKIHAVATEVARQSFNRLQENTQTEITVAVYDVQKTTFPQLLSNSKNWITQSTGYHDCMEDSGFDPVVAALGVEVYYRPPRFGALKNKPQHSGWECSGNSAASKSIP